MANPRTVASTAGSFTHGVLSGLACHVLGTLVFLAVWLFDGGCGSGDAFRGAVAVGVMADVLCTAAWCTRFMVRAVRARRAGWLLGWACSLVYVVIALTAATLHSATYLNGCPDALPPPAGLL